MDICSTQSPFFWPWRTNCKIDSHCLGLDTWPDPFMFWFSLCCCFLSLFLLCFCCFPKTVKSISIPVPKFLGFVSFSWAMTFFVSFSWAMTPQLAQFCSSLQLSQFARHRTRLARNSYPDVMSQCHTYLFKYKYFSWFLCVMFHKWPSSSLYFMLPHIRLHWMSIVGILARWPPALQVKYTRDGVPLVFMGFVNSWIWIYEFRSWSPD